MNAEVLVKFKGDTDQLDKSTSKATKTVNNFASGVAKGFKVAGAAIVTAATAVGVLVKKSVEAYAEFEQLEGGLVSLFGQGSKEMNSILKSSEEAYKTLTMSQNDYLTTFQSSYPLVNAGLSENADSIEYTNKMLQISSDLFNTYGGSIETYQNAINWALKGSFVYLDNLNIGIKGTQEGFIQAANASGVLGRTIKDVSEVTSDEIIDVIQHYTKEYGVWGKTAEEAGSTILGSLNMVKATWNNFIAGLSKSDADINQLIDNLVNSVMTFTSNIIPVIERTLQAVANSLPKLATQITKNLPGLIKKILPGLIDGALNLIRGLVKAFPKIVPVLMDGLTQALKGLLPLIPEIIPVMFQMTYAIVEELAEQLPTLLPMIIDAILGIIPLLISQTDLFYECGFKLLVGLLKGIINALPNLLSGIGNVIVAVIKHFMVLPEKALEIGKSVLEKVWEFVKQIPGKVIEGTKALFEFINTLPERLGIFLGTLAGKLVIFVTQTIPNFIKSVIQWFKELPQNIKTVFNNVIDSVKNWINDMKTKMQNEIPKLISKIINWFKELPSNMVSIGRDMVSGLWKGISNMKNWVAEKIKGFGKGIVSGLKSTLGIHSPSKEFAMVGKFSVLGYTETLEKMKRDVEQQVESTFGLNPQLTSSMQNTFTPNIQVYNNVNVEQDPLGQMVKTIKTFSGGSPNDYNYGAGV